MQTCRKGRMNWQFIHKISFNTKVKQLLDFTKGLIFNKVKINTYTKLTTLAFSNWKSKPLDNTGVTYKYFETLHPPPPIKAIPENLRKVIICF